MKVFEGVIVSLKMNQTAVVEISRRTPHPLYRKLIKRSKKFKVDTAGMELAVGNIVKITETRPISKGKYFKVLAISGVGKTKKAVAPKLEEKVEKVEVVKKKPVKKAV